MFTISSPLTLCWAGSTSSHSMGYVDWCHHWPSSHMNQHTAVLAPSLFHVPGTFQSWHNTSFLYSIYLSLFVKFLSPLPPLLTSQRWSVLSCFLFMWICVASESCAPSCLHLVHVHTINSLLHCFLCVFPSPGHSCSGHLLPAFPDPEEMLSPLGAPVFTLSTLVLPPAS